MISIRQQLVVGFTVVLITVLAASGIAAYYESRHEVEELFDAELATSARVLQSLIDPELMPDPRGGPVVFETFPEMVAHEEGVGHAEGEEAQPLGHKYEKKLALQVWDSEARLLARSQTAPTSALAPLIRGYSTQQFGGYQWRVFSLYGNARWYQVAERGDIRDELSREIALHTILPLLIAVPVTIVLLLIVIRRSLKPLDALAADVGTREAHHLSPVALRSLPRELQTVVDAVNGLFGRLSAAFERERLFAADAAHELRTPLAALSVHAQNAQTAQNEDQRAESMSKMSAGLARTTHVVEQLLALSRVEPTAADGRWENVDLAVVVEGVISEQKEYAASKDMTLTAMLTERAVVRGNRILLTLLVGNVLDNALRYTPAGGNVEVRVAQDSDAIVLSVSDDGPGIPQALRFRVFDRFVRLTGRHEEGSGLGLSIVRRIADLHKASISINSNSVTDERTGLVFTARFTILGGW